DARHAAPPRAPSFRRGRGASPPRLPRSPMSAVRYLLIALVVVVPAWIGHHFVAEHPIDPGNPFLPLFQHLMPAPLITNPETAHHEGPHYLLSVDVPGPAAFDADATR